MITNNNKVKACPGFIFSLRNQQSELFTCALAHRIIITWKFSGLNCPDLFLRNVLFSIVVADEVRSELVAE